MFAVVQRVRFTRRTALDPAAVEPALHNLAVVLTGTPDQTGAVRSPDACVQEFRQRMHGRNLEQSALYRFIKTQYRTQFGQEPAYAALPGTCTYSAKNGTLCLPDIARQVTARFEDNCAELGCRGPRRLVSAGPILD